MVVDPSACRIDSRWCRARPVDQRPQGKQQRALLRAGQRGDIVQVTAQRVEASQERILFDRRSPASSFAVVTLSFSISSVPTASSAIFAEVTALLASFPFTAPTPIFPSISIRPRSKRVRRRLRLRGDLIRRDRVGRQLGLGDRAVEQFHRRDSVVGKSTGAGGSAGHRHESRPVIVLQRLGRSVVPEQALEQPSRCGSAAMA